MENCLTESKTQELSLQGKPSTGQLQKIARLNHCHAVHEDAFSRVRTHLSSDEVLKSVPNEMGQPHEAVSLHETFEQTGMQSALRRLMDITLVHTKDGKSFMNISPAKLTLSVSTIASATVKSMYSQKVAPIRPQFV